MVRGISFLFELLDDGGVREVYFSAVGIPGVFFIYCDFLYYHEAGTTFPLGFFTVLHLQPDTVRRKVRDYLSHIGWSLSHFDLDSFRNMCYSLDVDTSYIFYGS